MLILDEEFTEITYKAQDLSREGYDNCMFTNCNFSEADLADVNFMECIFRSCHFGNVPMDSVGFKDVTFEDCNFLGSDFSSCAQFLLKMCFQSCQLDLSIMSNMKLKGTEFNNCKMKEVDFSTSDLTECSFTDCDLYRAVFQNCNLTKTDFEEARNYSFEPSQNILKKTKFSKGGIIGLLSRYDIIVK